MHGVVARMSPSDTLRGYADDAIVRASSDLESDVETATGLDDSLLVSDSHGSCCDLTKLSAMTPLNPPPPLGERTALLEQ